MTDDRFAAALKWCGEKSAAMPPRKADKPDTMTMRVHADLAELIAEAWPDKNTRVASVSAALRAAAQAVITSRK